MNAYQLKFWPTVERDRDIASQNGDRLTNTSPLAAVVQEHPNCPSLYAEPRHFFNATYLTAELKQLFKEVLGALCGQPGQTDRDRHIFPLVGDRDFSQTFLCLYHLTKHPQKLRQIPQLLGLPTCDSFKVAAFVSFDLDIHTGIEVEPGLRIFTPWGYLAWQLGGTFAYSLVKIHDEERVAPSEYLLRSFLGDRSTLLLLEDFLDYVEQTVEILGRDAQFSQQLLIFIQNLTAVVEGQSNTVLVYSLPGSQDSLIDAIAHHVNPNDQLNQPTTICKVDTSLPTLPVESADKSCYTESENFASIAFREEGTGNGERGIGNREQGIGNRERGIGNREPEKSIVTNMKCSREISPKIQPLNREPAEAIAVVSLDDRTYHPRPVSAPKRRNKTRAKIWAAKSDRLPSKTIPFANGFSTQVGNFLLHNIPTVANQYTTAETGDRTKGKIKQISNPRSDRLRKNTAVRKKDTAVRKKDTAVPFPYRDGGAIAFLPTLDRWHKLSDIDLVINELMARSPP